MPTILMHLPHRRNGVRFGDVKCGGVGRAVIAPRNTGIVSGGAGSSKGKRGSESFRRWCRAGQEETKQSDRGCGQVRIKRGCSQRVGTAVSSVEPNVRLHQQARWQRFSGMFLRDK